MCGVGLAMTQFWGEGTSGRGLDNSTSRILDVIALKNYVWKFLHPERTMECC